MADARFWLGFNLIAGIGPARVRRLLGHFGTSEAAWYATGPALAESGLDSRAVDQIVSRRPQIDLDREMERVDKVGASLVTFEDAAYPPLLRHVSDAPPLLYV